MMKRMARVVPIVVLAAAFASPAVASAATVGDWELNETSGTKAADSSGNHNDGVSKNIDFGTPGSYGFNGTSSQITVPASNSLVAGSKDITLSIRFTSSFPAGTGSFDWDMVKKGGYKIEIYRKGGKDQARCAFTGSSAKIAFQDGPSLTDNKPHTVSCTKTASAVTLTVDGTKYTKSGTVGTITKGNTLWIGWGGDNTDFFHGTLDYVKVAIG